MSRIKQTFAALDRPALITFITAGDPDLKTSQAAMDALANSGADIIELGMPFSDPMADGETIQKANIRALKNNANMIQTLKMVQDFRSKNESTPIVLMGYYNPVLTYGLEKFANDAAKSGVDGLIIVDLPPEESKPLQTAIKKCSIDLIRLITPTTNESRLKTLLNGASGFLYYVSITGVTGAASANLNAIKPHIQDIKTHTDLPVAIGFGIKTPDDAAKMGEIADGVVVGSSIVSTMEGHSGSAAIGLISKKVTALSKALKT